MSGERHRYRREEIDAHAALDAAAGEAVVVGERTDAPEIVFKIALAKIHSLVHLPKIENSHLQRVCCHQ